MPAIDTKPYIEVNLPVGGLVIYLALIQDIRFCRCGSKLQPHGHICICRIKHHHYFSLAPGFGFFPHRGESNGNIGITHSPVSCHDGLVVPSGNAFVSTGGLALESCFVPDGAIIRKVSGRLNTGNVFSWGYSLLSNPPGSAKASRC